MPNYTEIPQWFREQHKTKFQNIDLDKIPELAEQNPEIFGKFYLGKTLRLHQAFILDKFVSSMSKGHIRIAMCLARQLGKEQPYSAKVLTLYGFKDMGQLKIGNWVIAADGTPTPIVDIFERGEKDVYKITFDDGSFAECGLEHLWKCQTSYSRGHKNGKWELKSLKEIFDFLRKSPTQGYVKYRPEYKSRSISIPLCNPIDFPAKDLFLDSYVMGALIGDGGLTCRSIAFTSADDMIMERVSKSLPLGITFRKYKQHNHYQCYLRGVSGKNVLMEYLDKIGLMGKRSENKFIPEIYKLNSITNRVELLRGLCDTDGSITFNGVIEYCTVSPKLAEDVQWLVHSLGGKCSIKF